MAKIGLTAMLAVSACMSGPVLAQDAPANATKLSKADCQGIWSTADSSGAGSLTSAQAQPFVTNFKAVDANGDGKVSSEEFMAGCQKGLAHDSATSGASSGGSGSDRSPPPSQKY